MQILPVLTILAGSAMCSLEPAGYRLSSSYLPPSSRYGGPSPSSTYLPASSSSSRLQNTYSASQNNYQHQSSYRRSQSSYQAPSYQSSQDYNSVSASTYLPPSNRNQSFSALPSRYVPAPPKDTYFLPEVVKAQNFNALSTSYGVPEYNDAHLRDYHHHNHEDNSSSEPAKYNFGYQVKDNYGNDYSHQESRNGAKTHGSYSVLLPDGRKQIVEYEADEAGYRPKISYENVQTDRAAYPGGGPY